MEHLHCAGCSVKQDCVWGQTKLQERQSRASLLQQPKVSNTILKVHKALGHYSQERVFQNPPGLMLMEVSWSSL